jgi:hypothetical protein
MSITQSLAQHSRWQPNQQSRFEKWTQEANTIHNNKFDYSNVLYTNSHNKVNIICPEHGIFIQRACDHIHQKQGCPKCSHNFAYTHDEFVTKSKIKYQDKFTIISTYTGMKHSITVECKNHGVFTLTMAEKHLVKNGGCPTCWYLGLLTNLKPGNISKAEKQWLDSLNIPLRQEKIIIDDQTYLVDGFDPLTNTVYEYYGSFWHGNPKKYSPNEINTKTNTTFGELYNRTVVREHAIIKQYNLITKWGP